MLPLEYITVGGLLRRTTALFPNRMAVIDRETRLTYRQFDELTDRYATALLRQGVGRGDHVALFGEAEAEGRALFTDILRQVAERVFIPLTVGGGINSVADFDRVLKCGQHRSGPDRPGNGASARRTEAHLHRSVLPEGQGSGRGCESAGQPPGCDGRRFHGRENGLGGLSSSPGRGEGRRRRRC